MYEWDEDKRHENLRKHGVDFAIVEGFDWDHAVVFEDTREAYHERRWVAFAPIGDRLFALVFTMRGDVTRVISLRKATKKERKLYGEEVNPAQS